MSEIILTIEGVDLVALFGENNGKLNLVRKAYPDVTITSRGSNFKIRGDKTADTQAVKDKIEMMIRMLREHKELSNHVVEDMLRGENPYEVRLSTAITRLHLPAFSQGDVGHQAAAPGFPDLS